MLKLKLGFNQIEINIYIEALVKYLLIKPQRQKNKQNQFLKTKP